MISPWCGLALQFGGAVVITGFITAALVSLSLGRDVLRARLLVAEGVIGGLGVMTAATLLRTIASHLAADLEAIRRGYGNGLKSYRRLVYAHIAPSKLQTKLHNYFSPEEIAAIQMKVQEHPDLLAHWREHVLANLQEIRSSRREVTYMRCLWFGARPHTGLSRYRSPHGGGRSGLRSWNLRL